ncbi:Trm112 family protein [Buchnera aphidicola]|uniref:Uncharacterized protein n=1 Tax=Buchnera aphidicola subsp. Melaphis rhois TaxID=118103 RepID=A0A4D6Y1H6_BUCMH|nr:Trm112 family protein [Buchnera aphidicola]QCI23346.1 hypothetical protein D9V73_01660 [Buchnera aphidicola (Melaphis rhois)]
MRKEFIDILVCPICLNKLIYDKDNDELLCTLDEVAFPVYKKIPILLKHFSRKIITNDFN